MYNLCPYAKEFCTEVACPYSNGVYTAKHENPDFDCSCICTNENDDGQCSKDCAEDI